MKHRIVFPAQAGPSFYEFKDFESMAACMLAWITCEAGRSMKYATAWKLKYGRWVPAFNYHPGDSICPEIL